MILQKILPLVVDQEIFKPGPDKLVDGLLDPAPVGTQAG